MPKKSPILREKKILALLIGLCIIVYSAIGFWKYAHFRYNAIDLAYFNQVFWNSLQGHFFSQTIHSHPSLGDHAELLIPVLLPFYALWPDPRMLILLQAAALALAAWPIWRIAHRRQKGWRCVPLGTVPKGTHFPVADKKQRPLRRIPKAGVEGQDEQHPTEGRDAVGRRERCSSRCGRGVRTGRQSRCWSRFG